MKIKSHVQVLSVQETKTKAYTTFADALGQAIAAKPGAFHEETPDNYAEKVKAVLSGSYNKLIESQPRAMHATYLAAMQRTQDIALTNRGQVDNADKMAKGLISPNTESGRHIIVTAALGAMLGLTAVFGFAGILLLATGSPAGLPISLCFFPCALLCVAAVKYLIHIERHDAARQLKNNLVKLCENEEV